MNMLLQQLMQQGKGGNPNDPRAKLLQALAKRGGPQSRDARYRSLAALPPYSEQSNPETFGGQGQNDFGAFQDDAYQEGGYQIF